MYAFSSPQCTLHDKQDRKKPPFLLASLRLCPRRVHVARYPTATNNYYDSNNKQTTEINNNNN